MSGIASEIRISSYAPPTCARVAVELRFRGVCSRELLEHAERWGDEWARAWRECDRLELVLPIALTRGASLDVATTLAVAWWRAAVHELAGVVGAVEGLRALGWTPPEAAAAARLVDFAIAPDVDVRDLIDRRAQALEHLHATERSRQLGRHRSPLMYAAIEIASLGILRPRQPMGSAAMSSGWMLAELLLSALRGASDAADLFARVDVDAWVAAQIALAHARIGEL